MNFSKEERRLATMLGLALGAAVLVGCGSRGAGDAPYGSAVSSLEEHGTKIRDAFSAGKPEDAHDSLHEIGNILDQFPKLVDSTRLSEADRASAKQAADELFDAYTELDMSLHGGEQATYDDVAEKIDANLTVLKSKIAAAGGSGEPITTVAHEGHDHAHDDHGHSDHDHADHDHAEHDHADHDHDHGEEDHDHAHEDDADHNHEHDDDARAPAEPGHP